MKIKHLAENWLVQPMERGKRGKPKTHCPHGHEMTPENTVVTHGFGIYPRRECRTCRRSRDARGKKNKYWRARGVDPEKVLTFAEWSGKQQLMWKGGENK